MNKIQETTEHTEKDFDIKKKKIGYDNFSDMYPMHRLVHGPRLYIPLCTPAGRQALSEKFTSINRYELKRENTENFENKDFSILYSSVCSVVNLG